MKKLKHITLSIILCLCMLFPQTISAKTKLYEPEELSEYEYHFLDLNQDGKKEKISYVTFIDYGWAGMIEYGPKTTYIYIYINDQCVYEKKMPNVTDCTLYYMDINKKDKKLDLLLRYSREEKKQPYYSCGFQLLQYSEGKLNKINVDSNVTSKLGRFSRKNQLLDEIVSWIRTDGKGTLFVQTHIKNIAAIGNNHDEAAPLQIKNNSLQLKFGEPFDSFDSDDNNYTLNRNCSLYKESSTKSKKLTILEKGQTVTIKKLLPRWKSQNEKGQIAAYAYVKDKKGNQGWIYLNQERPSRKNPKAVFTNY